jgi:acetylornithine deacetylase
MARAGQAGVDVDVSAIQAAVAAESDAMEELLCRLVEQPTTLGNEEPGQAVMETAFRTLGLETIDVPLQGEELRASGLASPFGWSVEGKRNVVGTWRGLAEGGRTLLLNGHIDVVPAGGPHWSRPPFEPSRDGEWLRGRGAGDMKAGLAAMVGAVRGLQRLGLAPLGDVELQSVVEEEVGGNGALQCALSRPERDAVVIPEPFPEAIETTQVGVLWFHVDIAGLPAHAGEAQAGVNAIEAAFPIVAALRELERELNLDPPAPYDAIDHPIKLNIGPFRGGDWPSSVAAECSFTGRLAQFPGRPIASLKRRVEETVARAARDHPYLADHPPAVRYEGFAVEGTHVSADASIVTALREAHRRTLGIDPPCVASTATTDARAYIATGTPAVCFGPKAENIHGVDERVHFPSVVTTAQVLAVLIRDWCGVTA